MFRFSSRRELPMPHRLATMITVAFCSSAYADVAPPTDGIIDEHPMLAIFGGCIVAIGVVWAIYVAVAKSEKKKFEQSVPPDA